MESFNPIRNGIPAAQAGLFRIDMGVSESQGTLFGALIVRILLFGGTILGSPITGHRVRKLLDPESKARVKGQ